MLSAAALIACSEEQGADPGAAPATATGALTSTESASSTSATSGHASSTTGMPNGTSSGTSSSSSGTQTGASSTGAIGTTGVGGSSGGTQTATVTSSNTTTTGTDATAAGGSGGMGSAGSTNTTGSATGPTLPPITDYSDEGPFTTTQDDGVGPNGSYTVIRPESLGEDGFLHAPIVFGPGIGQQWSVHTEMLTNFASHGFVVVACPVLNGGPGDAGNRMTMLAGLDWIVEQNGTGGMYPGKIYVDRAISMGFSVGGTSAVEIGGHEAVATVVSIHGHTASAELHGPLLQTTGTEDGLGKDLQQDTYEMSEVQTFLATLTGAPHQYIESNGGGEQRPAIVAWMRYWIYNDDGARDYFFGDDCVLCTAPWENPQRKNWSE
ncbi:MAG TPA: hypothetical protein VI197_02790 [Polyangiaceae bacterium]